MIEIGIKSELFVNNQLPVISKMNILKLSFEQKNIIKLVKIYRFTNISNDFK